jgi:hypothetical protein
MGVSGQHHAPAALYPRGKDPRYPLDKRLGGPPRAGLDAEAWRKILCLCRGSNPGRPVSSQTLYWLSYPEYRLNVIKFATQLLVLRVLWSLTWRCWSCGRLPTSRRNVSLPLRTKTCGQNYVLSRVYFMHRTLSYLTRIKMNTIRNAFYIICVLFIRCNTYFNLIYETNVLRITWI